MIREIRKINPEIPVLLMTGYIPAEIVPEDLEAC